MEWADVISLAGRTIVAAVVVLVLSVGAGALLAWLLHAWGER